MNQEFAYWVIAYYHIIPIEDPHEEVVQHKNFFHNRDIKSRIYISKEGINAQMSASPEAADEYMRWISERYAGIEFKLHGSHEQVFPKAIVKVRKQLVAMDCQVDLTRRGVHLTPEEWKKMLKAKGEHTVLIDVRNGYEWAIGHFEGAELPACDTFRQFPLYVQALKKEIDPKATPVMMYCTGGIRCEFASAYMLQEGFEQVFQLKGGIIDYGLQEGADYWQGKLFVFDDRLVVPIADQEETTTISFCTHCKCTNDVYYNCANIDCNALFLCCLSCLHEHKGCCSSSCMQAKRVRPYHTDGSSKPFRKMKEEK